MIFIVSVRNKEARYVCELSVTNFVELKNAKEPSVANTLAHQVHRVGHHVRETIVEEARASLGQAREYDMPVLRGAPEPIPESQEEYDAQVDAALRDLFPRIPNTDRQMIIEHAFRRVCPPSLNLVLQATDIYDHRTRPAKARRKK
jgi:hypothetical protein